VDFLIQEAKEIESRLAQPVVPPADRKEVEPKDEKLLKGQNQK